MLEKTLPEGCQLFAYADDALLMCKAKTIPILTSNTNLALGGLYQWGCENKLQFNPRKTTAMMVTRKRKIMLPLIKMNQENIKLADQIS